MPLTPHALAALALTICALILFSRERIPLEYSATAILVTIVMAFELFPLTGPVPLRGAHFLEGFGNDALITICLLLILARGVEVSGGLRPIGRLLTRIWLFNRVIALLVTLVIAAFVSAFKILMPVGFATIIGGMSTTIGTSTNLLVVSVSEELGLERLQMFDFTLPAVLAAGAGILRPAVAARRHQAAHLRLGRDDRGRQPDRRADAVRCHAEDERPDPLDPH
jgi:di/tricarboxylate transporter